MTPERKKLIEDTWQRGGWPTYPLLIFCMATRAEVGGPIASQPIPDVTAEALQYECDWSPSGNLRRVVCEGITVFESQ